MGSSSGVFESTSSYSEGIYKDQRAPTTVAATATMNAVAPTGSAPRLTLEPSKQSPRWSRSSSPFKVVSVSAIERRSLIPRRSPLTLACDSFG